MKVENWSAIPEIQMDIMKRRIFTGENVMLVRNELEPGTVVEAHSHPHEQIIYILSGECDVVIGGTAHHLVAETMALCPPNVEHAVTVTGNGPMVALDIFSPIREDFLA